MHIRAAVGEDIARLAEIEIFNYRLKFYPIFRNDDFYFSELTVPAGMEEYRSHPLLLQQTYVYDDGVVKGFIRVQGTEIQKLFVEPVLQRQGIGSALLQYAVNTLGARTLWALEKNTPALAFYAKQGFHPNGRRKLETGTAEYLIELQR